MPPLTADELGTALAAADAEAVAGFLAELYAARGRRVERRGGVLFVGEGDGRERVVVAGGAVDGGAADRVVVAGRDVAPDELAAPPIDAAALADALLYAIDRDTAETLLDRWLDRSLADFEGATGTRPRSERQRGADDGAGGAAAATAAGADSDGGPSAAHTPETSRATGAPGWRTLPVRAALVAIALVLLAVAAGAAWPTGAPGGEDVAGSEETASEGGDWDLFSDADAGSTATPGTATPDGATAPSAGQHALPPGVAPSGDVDASTLLAAHEAELQNRSYRVSISYREYVDGTETGTFLQSVRVANATTYRVSTVSLGTFAEGPVTLARGTTDGVSDPSYEWEVGRVHGATRRTTDPVLGEMLRYLGYYLSVEQSRVADVRPGDDGRIVRLTTRGDSWAGAVNTTGNAVVEGSRLVRSVRRSYDVPESNVHVEVTLRVSDVGRTNVSAPTPGDG